MKLLNVSMGILSLLALGACGGDDDDGTADYSKPTTAFAAVSKGYCAKAIECGDSAPDGGFSFESAAECEAFFAALVDAEDDDAVAAGRQSWNEADARYCSEASLAAISAASCAEFWEDGLDLGTHNTEPRCEGLGDGLVPDGGSCESDNECAVEGSLCIDGNCEPSA